MTSNLSFDEGLKIGEDLGFCSQQFCHTHDLPPLTETEDNWFSDGGDPCVHVVRLGSPEDWEHNL